MAELGPSSEPSKDSNLEDLISSKELTVAELNQIRLRLGSGPAITELPFDDAEFNAWYDKNNTTHGGVWGLFAENSLGDRDALRETCKAKGLYPYLLQDETQRQLFLHHLKTYQDGSESQGKEDESFRELHSLQSDVLSGQAFNPVLFSLWWQKTFPRKSEGDQQKFSNCCQENGWLVYNWKEVPERLLQSDELLADFNPENKTGLTLEQQQSLIKFAQKKRVRFDQAIAFPEEDLIQLADQLNENGELRDSNASENWEELLTKAKARFTAPNSLGDTASFYTRLKRFATGGEKLLKDVETITPDEDKRLTEEDVEKTLEGLFGPFAGGKIKLHDQLYIAKVQIKDSNLPAPQLDESAYRPVAQGARILVPHLDNGAGHFTLKTYKKDNDKLVEEDDAAWDPSATENHAQQAGTLTCGYWVLGRIAHQVKEDGKFDSKDKAQFDAINKAYNFAQGKDKLKENVAVLRGVVFDILRHKVAAEVSQSEHKQETYDTLAFAIPEGVRSFTCKKVNEMDDRALNAAVQGQGQTSSPPASEKSRRSQPVTSVEAVTKALSVQGYEKVHEDSNSTEYKHQRADKKYTLHIGVNRDGENKTSVSVSPADNKASDEPNYEAEFDEIAQCYFRLTHPDSSIANEALAKTELTLDDKLTYLKLTKVEPPEKDAEARKAFLKYFERVEQNGVVYRLDENGEVVQANPKRAQEDEDNRPAKRARIDATPEGASVRALKDCLAQNLISVPWFNYALQQLSDKSASTDATLVLAGSKITIPVAEKEAAKKVMLKSLSSEKGPVTFAALASHRINQSKDEDADKLQTLLVAPLKPSEKDGAPVFDYSENTKMRAALASLLGLSKKDLAVISKGVSKETYQEIVKQATLRLTKLRSRAGLEEAADHSAVALKSFVGAPVCTYSSVQQWRGASHQGSRNPLINLLKANNGQGEAVLATFSAVGFTRGRQETRDLLNEAREKAILVLLQGISSVADSESLIEPLYTLANAAENSERATSLAQILGLPQGDGAARMAAFLKARPEAVEKITDAARHSVEQVLNQKFNAAESAEKKMDVILEAPEYYRKTLIGKISDDQERYKFDFASRAIDAMTKSENSDYLAAFVEGQDAAAKQALAKIMDNRIPDVFKGINLEKFPYAYLRDKALAEMHDKGMAESFDDTDDDGEDDEDEFQGVLGGDGSARLSDMFEEDIDDSDDENNEDVNNSLVGEASFSNQAQLSWFSSFLSSNSAQQSEQKSPEVMLNDFLPKVKSNRSNLKTLAAFAEQNLDARKAILGNQTFSSDEIQRLQERAGDFIVDKALDKLNKAEISKNQKWTLTRLKEMSQKDKSSIEDPELNNLSLVANSEDEELIAAVRKAVHFRFQKEVRVESQFSMTLEKAQDFKAKVIAIFDAKTKASVQAEDNSDPIQQAVPTGGASDGEGLAAAALVLTAFATPSPEPGGPSGGGGMPATHKNPKGNSSDPAAKKTEDDAISKAKAASAQGHSAEAVRFGQQNMLDAAAHQSGSSTLVSGDLKEMGISTVLSAEPPQNSSSNRHRFFNFEEEENSVHDSNQPAEEFETESNTSSDSSKGFLDC